MHNDIVKADKFLCAGSNIPIKASAAIEIMLENPNMPIEQVVDILDLTSDTNNDGEKIINAKKALEFARKIRV